MANKTSFARLLESIVASRRNVILVDGPRGVGKSTIVDRMCSTPGYQYYKTWGSDQRSVRLLHENAILDLPQATFFVLDYLRQIPSDRCVVCDRGNVSAMVYQAPRYGSISTVLHNYYADLMRSTRAMLLFLDAPVDTLVSRRRARRGLDEDALYLMSMREARRVVVRDRAAYRVALLMMRTAGLVRSMSLRIEGTSCDCYIADSQSLGGPHV